MEVKSSQNRRERFYRYAPLILWVGVIFYLSTGQASMPQTSRFVRPLLEFIFPGALEETLVFYHSYIRKAAHFIEYAILGFWAAWAFAGSSSKFLRKYRHLVSFLSVVLIASIDETNQSFNPARTGSPWDVLLDASGGAAMILIYYLMKIKHKID